MRWPSFWSSSSPQDDKDEAEGSTPRSNTQTPGQVLDDLLLSQEPSNPDPRPAHPRPISSKKSSPDFSSLLTPSPSRELLSPANIAPTLLLTGTILAFYTFYRSYLRRLPAAGNISPGFFRKRSLLGRVTSVGDGDDFRFFHTPGGRLAGWGWLPGRKVPDDRKLLKGKTIHIRLAGIDAPELAHFGRPSQPYSQDALKWLTDYILHRQVRAYIYRRDQYERIIATVYVRKAFGFLRRDVGLQMLRAGLATVYAAKTGAEFGPLGREEKYRKALWWARFRKKGMWAPRGGGGEEEYESPGDYKARYRKESPSAQPVGVNEGNKKVKRKQ